MNFNSFTHLSVSSQYSLFESTISPKDLISRLKEMGQKYVCISDRNNLFAAIKVYQNARKEGLKPLLSCKLSIEYEGVVGEVTLICKNKEGYLNLTKLVSLIYKPDIGNGDFISYSHLQSHSNGLILLCGGSDGIIGKNLLSGNNNEAKVFAKQLKNDFGDRFYIELSRTGHHYDSKLIRSSVSLAILGQIDVVATNKVKFLDADNFLEHEVRASDAQGITLTAFKDKYPNKYSPHQYLKSTDEMYDLFSDIPMALENTDIIAKRCNVELELDKPILPKFPTNGESEASYLVKLSEKGLEKRLLADFPDRFSDKTLRENYFSRLHHELSVINDMGFPGYFLIVADFIQWSKNNGIPVGPGRGSGAGSLVAYALGITNLDPIKYSLLFERFLNPERVSMPDFDIDFCMDRRDEVINYVAEKYGYDAVSQIITFGTLAAKAAVKTAARVMGYPYNVGDKISKLIPNEPGIKLSKALEQTDMQTLRSSDLDADKIISMALSLEGVVRQTGKHAGGVVISPTSITDFSATYADEDGGNFVCQFDKNDIETAGLVKFDFLGLKTLTIVDNAINYVNESRAKKGLEPINIDDIALNDERVYKLYAKGETAAVFQVESKGMKELLKKLKPDCFEDIVALVALFRPGPLQSGMVDNFIDRKHGREKVSYPDEQWQHDSLKEILEPTYGIILYQEQVMQIAQVLAGYTLGGADMLRRAMGKKKPEEMEKQRKTFEQGAINNGVDGKLAMKIFDLVEKFAGYGFNKSHSAAYALVSYQTAWLKVHYPAEFMAAVMSADVNNTDKIVNYTNESKRIGLQVLPPDINKSSIGFTPIDGDKIYMGLEAIKGFGSNNITPLLEERDANGKFTNIFDFASRSPKVTKNIIKYISMSGGFDQFDYNRKTIIENTDTLIKFHKQQKKKSIKQSSLFGEEADSSIVQFDNIYEDYTNKERLISEINTIGVSLSGHLLDDYKDMITDLSKGKLSDYLDTTVEDGNPDSVEHQVWEDKFIEFPCVISQTNIRLGQKEKQQRATMLLDDGTRIIDAIAFNKVCFESSHYIFDHNVVLVKGKLTYNAKTDTHQVIIFDIASLDSILHDKLHSIEVSIDSQMLSNQEVKEKLRLLRDLLKDQQQGECPVLIRYIKDKSESSIMPLGQESYLISSNLLTSMNGIFGTENITKNLKDKVSSKLHIHHKQASKEQLQEGINSRDDRHARIAKALDMARMSMR